MARARNIKPGFFTNDELAECQPLARILFAGLWTLADREGRLEDRPKKIKVELLPYDDCDIDLLLNELASKYEGPETPTFIYRYIANGKKYIQIMHFKEHQNPHVKEAASTIPAPDLHSTCTGQEQSKQGTSKKEQGDKPSKINMSGQHCTSTVQAPDKHTTSRADSLLPITDSLLLNPSTESITAREAKPVDNFLSDTTDELYPSGNAAEETAATLADDNGQSLESSGDFMSFWNAYPKRSGMPKAMEAWKSLTDTGFKPEFLVMAARRYAIQIIADKTETKFIKMPHNFLLEGAFYNYLPRNLPQCPRCHGTGSYDVEEDDGLRVAICDCRKVLFPNFTVAV